MSRFVKLSLTGYFEVDEVTIDNFARWPQFGDAVRGFEESTGNKCFAVDMKVMDEDFTLPTTGQAFVDLT